MDKIKKTLISFATTNLESARNRFQAQAEAMNFFDDIKVYDENDLGLEFKDHFKSILNHETRGFGYWVWKPQVIKQELLKAGPDDKLVYCDAGYHLNPKGLNRLNEYLDILDKSKSGILVFEQPDKSKFPDRMFKDKTEKFFTKADLFYYFNLQNNIKSTDSPQFTASCILLKKTEASLKFLEEWLKPAYADISLLDNSPSKNPDFPGFIWHQNDQSVFSLLCKTTPNIEILPESELCVRVKKNKLFKIDEHDWRVMQDKPFWFKQHTSNYRYYLMKVKNIFLLNIPFLKTILKPYYFKFIRPAYRSLYSLYYRLNTKSNKKF